jgi:Mg2+ and Co2+ transporter CorA
MVFHPDIAGGLAKHRQRRKSLFPPGTKYTDALPENVEKVSLCFAHIRSFFGADPYREIRANLEGYELLDIKGLVYWKERLRRYAAKVAALKDLISSQLDEKRNFMSFMLTIITTILAPLAILTGYFGMNFGNMKELDPDTYPATPGVQLMWVICGVCYGALLLVSLHFRVLYSAT